MDFGFTVLIAQPPSVVFAFFRDIDQHAGREGTIVPVYDRITGPEILSSTRAIDDPHLHDFVAELGGTIVAKAQMVTICDTIAYTSDMYTRPESRRKGLGSALLAHLHVRAMALGKHEMILVPSLMTRQVGFYEQHGYREAVPMHLSITDC